MQICDILFLDSVGVWLGGGGKSREGHEIFLSEEKSDRNVKTTGTRISSFLVCIQKRAQYHLPKDQGGNGGLMQCQNIISVIFLSAAS